MRSHQALKIAMVACIRPTLECTIARHRPAGDLGIALRDRDRAFLVQAQQHLRLLVAEIIDEAVVQAAIARARIERDIGDVELAQRLGDDVAAEAGRVGAGRDRTLDRAGAVGFVQARFGAVLRRRHAGVLSARPGHDDRASGHAGGNAGPPSQRAQAVIDRSSPRRPCRRHPSSAPGILCRAGFVDADYRL